MVVIDDHSHSAGLQMGELQFGIPPPRKPM